ncbi:HAD family hydrolase [Halobacillus locisalis]|uniref:HAD family hydrolase n=1 Tax=Halobacillus locisalis TaxID=220753 RepID=A0A838CQ70_9BACI|nr:HAD family hydrolase [Halobacillus locisalis]MBA2173786.1 HAD family hydrolase [Halobacillus locisalis]
MKAVLFDLDGTLLDRDRTLLYFLENQYNRFFQNGQEKRRFMKRFIELDRGGYTPKSEVYPLLAEEFNFYNQEDLLEDYNENLQEYCQPFTGLLPMLEKLKSHYKLGIITNGRETMQASMIHKLGISRYFDSIVISETEGIKKPDPALFHLACERLQVAPHEAVFVGDHPENDIAAAQFVGMRGFWIMNERYDCAHADEYITDLDHLPFAIHAEGRVTQ